MPVSASNFTVTNSTPADITNLNTALSYLQSSTVGASTVQGAADNHVTINIVHDGSDGFNNQTNTVNWDPNSALGVLDTIGNAGTVGVQSAAVGLAHELTHGNDLAASPTQYATDVNTPVTSYGNKEEENAVQNEDAIAAQLGEPERYNHTDSGLPTEADPTEHTEAQNNGTVTWAGGSNSQTLGTYQPGTLPATTPATGGDTGANRSLTVDGNGKSISVDNGDNINVVGNDDNISTQNSTFNVSTNINLDVAGSGNALTLQPGSVVTFNLGSTEAISGSGGSVIMDVNGINLNDTASSLTVYNGPGGIVGAVTLNASNIGVTDEASNPLSVYSAAGVTGGKITMGANGLPIYDFAVGNLTINDASGVGGGAVAFEVNNSSVTDNAANLAFYTGSGASGGAVTINTAGGTIADNASNLTIYNGAGISNATILFGTSNLTLTDLAGGGLDVYSASGVTGGKVDLGASGIQGLVDYASSLSVDDASGVTGGAMQLGLGGSTLSDLANGLTISNGNGVSGTTTDVTNSVSANYSGSNSTVTLGQSDTLSASGGFDVINGGSHADILADGNYFTFYNSDSDINYYGGLGDVFDGSGDTSVYEGDGDGDGSLGGDGDGSDGDGSWGGYAYLAAANVSRASVKSSSILVKTGQVSATSLASTAVSKTSSSAPTFEGAKWRGGAITFNFSDGSSGNQLNAQEQAVVVAAFSAWAQASGLAFEQVSSSAQADISVNFADAAALSAGVLGQTSYATSGNQFARGVTVQFASPDQDPLVVGADGQLIYANSQVVLYQLALHEIGHALGLSDDSDPTSVMYTGLGSSNTKLDATDVSGIEQLYGQVQSKGNDNTFGYREGAGSETINQVGTNNVFAYGTGVTADQVRVSADAAGNVILTLPDNSRVTLANELNSTATTQYGVQKVTFSDGTTWSYADILAKADTASATNGSLYGDAGANTLDSKGLATYEQGNGGGDTFVYKAGYGALTIAEADTASTPSNKVAFGAGITPDQVKVTANASGDLILSLSETDQITLTGALDGGGGISRGVQAVTFANGASWSYADLLVRADTASASNTNLFGDTGANVLDSKGAAVFEQGNGGGDTYVFDRDYGSLTINNLSANTAPDGSLQFGPGIAADQLWFDRSGTNLVVDVLGTHDSVTIQNWFGDNPSSQIAALKTSDGETLGATNVHLLIQSMAAFETSYASSTGTAFDPTASGTTTISNPTVLAAVNANWAHG